MPIPLELNVLLVVTVATSLTTAFLAWRERPEPGATSLAILMAATSWWSAMYSLELLTTTLATKQFWARTEWFGSVSIPVAWVLFALSYTGHDRLTRRRHIALLSVVPVVTVVLVWTNSYHHLLVQHATLARQGQLLMLQQVRGPWFWVAIVYSYALAMVGSILFFRLVSRNSGLFRGQSLAILVAAITPLLSYVLYLAGAIPAGLDPTPFAFTVSGVASLGALTRFRLLGTSPAPSRRARRLVFERMRDGALVVDNHDYVVDMNESAVAILGTTKDAALGRPAIDIVPGFEALDDESSSTQLTFGGPGGGQHYDVAVTNVRDFHGREIGRVLSFHDISEYLHNQQRFEVLNRLLRHNIRTETNIIYGYADLLDENPDTDSSHVGVVKQRAMEVADMAEKAREIVSLFERTSEDRDRDATAVGSFVQSIVTAISREHPDLDVHIEQHCSTAVVDGVLEPVLRNVVENAVEHNPNPNPWLDVRVESDGEEVVISVADNGPGIAEHERTVLDRGTETPLEHGSGLGLWLIKWGVESAGGRVDFARNQPAGSVVTISVPTIGQKTPPDGEFIEGEPTEPAS